MIDFKEIERRLNEALEKETSESLTTWLLNERSEGIKSFLGNGTINSLHGNPTSFIQKVEEVLQYDSHNNSTPNNNFSLAA